MINLTLKNKILVASAITLTVIAIVVGVVLTTQASTENTLQDAEDAETQANYSFPSSFEFEGVKDSDGSVLQSSGNYYLTNDIPEYQTSDGTVIITSDNLLAVYKSDDTNNTFAILLNDNAGSPFFSSQVNTYLFIMGNSINNISEYISSDSLDFTEVPSYWIKQSTGNSSFSSYTFTNILS
tara:strand:+ start:3207 stop:3752 length:546 start_codon:yes stop_codon:yes gene_type:complete